MKIFQHVFYANVIHFSKFSTDSQFIESDKNVVTDALTCANVAFISDLLDPLDFEAIAEAQKSDADIQSLCNKITSLQLIVCLIRNSPNFLLCNISQDTPRILLNL